MCVDVCICPVACIIYGTPLRLYRSVAYRRNFTSLSIFGRTALVVSYIRVDVCNARIGTLSVRLVNDVAPGQFEMEGVCVYATRCGSHAGSRGKLRFFSSSRHHLDPSALLDRFLIEPTGMLKKKKKNDERTYLF